MVVEVKEETQEEKERKIRVANKPPLDEVLSLYDFEVRGPFCGMEASARC